MLDGEAVILGLDGISDFKALQSTASITKRFSSAPSMCAEAGVRDSPSARQGSIVR